MKLFSRKQQPAQPIIPPELQPYYNLPSHQKSLWRNRRVLLPLAVLVVLLIIIGLVIWLVIDHNSSSKQTGRSPAASQAPQSTKLPKNSGTPAQTPSSGKTNTKPVDNPAQ